MEWRLFLAKVLDKCNQNAGISNIENTWSDWAVDVRTHFSNVVNQAKSILKSANQDTIDQLGQGFSFRALSGHANEPVSDILLSRPINHSGIKITTIHDVKGETLDAVMVVSAVSKSGTTDGHWEQWLEDQDAEAARLAYVASSRPRHLLVWAVPEISEEQAPILTRLGFSHQSLSNSPQEADS